MPPRIDDAETRPESFMNTRRCPLCCAYMGEDGLSDRNGFDLCLGKCLARRKGRRSLQQCKDECHAACFWCSPGEECPPGPWSCSEGGFLPCVRTVPGGHGESENSTNATVPPPPPAMTPAPSTNAAVPPPPPATTPAPADPFG